MPGPADEDDDRPAAVLDRRGLQLEAAAAPGHVELGGALDHHPAPGLRPRDQGGQRAVGTDRLGERQPPELVDAAAEQVLGGGIGEGDAQPAIDDHDRRRDRDQDRRRARRLPFPGDPRRDRAHAAIASPARAKKSPSSRVTVSASPQRLTAVRRLVALAMPLTYQPMCLRAVRTAMSRP